MAENINQIIIQIAEVPYKRAVIQSGDKFTPDQVVVKYDDLTASEKTTWDNFYALIES